MRRSKNTTAMEHAAIVSLAGWQTMTTHHLATPPAKRTRPLPAPKAGEPLRVYGAASGSSNLRAGMRARDRAVIERALSILSGYMGQAGMLFDSPSTVKTYLRLQLDGERVEHFCVLYLDSQHRAIAFERHFTGTLSQTSVYPREVVRAALGHQAASVILAHNHPSGNATPSRADEALTQTLKAACALVDVRVLDHVIVAGGQALSMAEQGLV